jgi:uncharacterized protein
VIYVDTSALAKLVIPEAESAAMHEFAAVPLVTSAIAGTELRRTVRRRAPHLLVNAEHVLSRVAQITVDAEMLRAASGLDPLSLRTLDAIHLASALRVREEITTFVAYDKRLLDAAHLAGIPTASPGL